MSLASLLGISTRNPGECIVKIGGSEFSAFYKALQTTTITLNRRGSSEASLSFTMMMDGDGRYPLADDARIRTWAQVEIIVVFGDVEEPFFSGYIREINTNISQSGTMATVILNCQDTFAAMDRNCRQVTWDEGRSDLDIISEVIAPYGLSLAANRQAPQALENRHQNKTDFRFIRELAETYHYEWYLRHRELYYGEPNTSSQASGPKIMVHAGRKTNCLTFNVNYDGYQPDRIRTSTAPLTGREIEQTSSTAEIALFGIRSADSSGSGLAAFEWCLPPGAGNNQEAAKARSRTQANQASFKLKASGKLDGTAYGSLLWPGTVVEVGGTAENNGKWYVDTAEHTFGASGYFVDFTLIRNAAAGDESSTGHILAGVS